MIVHIYNITPILHCVRYEKAGSLGNTRALNLSGILYYYGTPSLPSDKIRAFELFLQAALGGYSLAWYNVGRCYEDGIGAIQSMVDSIKAYRYGANQNNYECMYSLGYIQIQNAFKLSSPMELSIALQNNQNSMIEKDYIEAVRLFKEGINWFQLSSEHISESNYQLGKLYESVIIIIV
jgi:hypothetical protein